MGKGYDFTGMTPADLRAYAKECRRESAESFERCDTDGFLSQKANQVTADVYELQATIMENGGRADFLALFDLKGNVVPAVRIDSLYGRQGEKEWAILDSSGRRYAGYFRPSKAHKPGVARANDAKKGYYVGLAAFPAKADIGGTHSWYARSVQLDERDFSDVVPVDNGHLEGPHAERYYRIMDGRFDRGE